MERICKQEGAFWAQASKMNVLKKKKSCLLVLGFSCNNNCIFCSVAHCRESNKDRGTIEIKRELAEKRKNGFRSVEFIGGEPTIRKDIIDIIAYAKKLGYSIIAITTNGKMFSYKEFTEQIIKAGLNRACVSLYGHNPTLHDGITRTPNSFTQTLEGIKNILSFMDHNNLYVSTVVCRQNYKYLDKIADLLADLGVKRWNLLGLIIEGRAKEFRDIVSLSLNELSSSMDKLPEYSKRLDFVFLFDFPYCILSDEILKKRRKFRIYALDDEYETFQTGYDKKNPLLSERKKEFKTELPICNDCRFKEPCGGVLGGYIKD